MIYSWVNELNAKFIYEVEMKNEKEEDEKKKKEKLNDNVNDANVNRIKMMALRLLSRCLCHLKHDR